MFGIPNKVAQPSRLR